MNMNRLIPMLLLSTFSMCASAKFVTIDAGNYSFSYNDRFWNTAAFSQSGDLFTFSNLSSALGTGVSGFLNHPDGGIQKNYYANGAYSRGAEIRIKADEGFRLASITTGMKGSLLAASTYDAANGPNGNHASATMQSHTVWQQGGVTRGQALIYEQIQAKRNGAGDLTTIGTSGPYDLSHTSIFGRDVFRVAGAFNVSGNMQLYGKGVSATSLLDTAYFNVAVVPIPEPETWALFLAGLGVLSAVARRRKRSEANRISCD